MRLPVVLLAALLLDGCAADAPPCREMLRAELFFGRNSGGVLRVSDADWRDFAAGQLSARFPGFTILDATGSWQREEEAAKVVIVIAEHSPATHAGLAEVASEYKRRFAQGSVLVIVAPTCAAY
jgi:hypothetical protein